MSEGLTAGQLMRRHRHAFQRGRLVPDVAAASAALRSVREARLAKLNTQLAANLPIAAHEDELLRAIDANQVVIVAGDTGSGKTTQIPKLCLRLGYGVGATIGHTQPRRLAARSVAARLAEEVGSELGGAVGYAVRFDERAGDETLVRLVTDGLLLTEIRTDRFLDAYDVVIVDEAHERSLNIDFLLGYLRRLCRRRRDLKVVITSATIDVERFSRFFAGAPVIRVGGRAYPVEVRYRAADEDTVSQIVDVLDEIEQSPGHGRARDVLVFLPGERDILHAARGIRKAFEARSGEGRGRALEVLPLYARLSGSDQRRIFAPSDARRRVILATNVAETALTVPNIGWVIDTGLARINRYSYRSKLQRLPVEPISRASAEQRKGRCGRVAPGVCYRLFEEAEFNSRPEFTDPEIRRVNLASVVLQMEAFRLGDIRKFPFLDPPEPRAVSDAMRLLTELQALDDNGLTAVGQAMARIPVDPRLARMLVEAGRQGAVSEVSVIVAGLAVQDPRQRPLQSAQAADQAHAEFADPRSDFLGWLNLWRWVEEQRQGLSSSRWQRLLDRRYIKPQQVLEWRAVHRQLRLVCRELGYRENARPAAFQTIHECIIAGSLSLIARHDEQGRYLGARGLKLRVFPGSSLADRTPRWIVAAEIAETRRVYARNVGAVEPGWIERQAAHLLKYQYGTPYWSAQRGEVMARLSASLYGLRLVENRQVSYARHDPVLCRDLFIRDGLVPGNVRHPPDFLRHNLLEIARIVDLESKGRRRDLLVAEDEIHAFYASRLPASVCRVVDLDKWLSADASHGESLVMSAADLLRGPAVQLAEKDFPSELDLEGITLQVSYRFAPGEPDDGVTLSIPVGVLNAINPESLEWLVPGLFEPLLEQWLRTLPKQKRRRLAPLPDQLTGLSEALLEPSRYRKGRLLGALARLLRDRHDLQIGEADWDRSRVAPHLLFYVRITDKTGVTLAAGRDLRQLKAELQNPRYETGDQTHPVADAEGLTSFPEETVPEQWLLGTRSAPVVKFPGFVDAGTAVHLRLFDAARERDRFHADGLCRLALLGLGQTGRYFRRELSQHPDIDLHFASLGGAQQLKEEILRSVVWRCFFEGRDRVETRAAFEARLTSCRGNLGEVFNDTVDVFARILAVRFECAKRLDEFQSNAYAISVADIRLHLDELAPRSVLRDTPGAYLHLIPDYLGGILHRIQRLEGHVPRDQQVTQELAPLLDRMRRLRSAEMIDDARIAALRFLMEELRFKVHAQAAYRRHPSHPLDESHLGPGWKPSMKRVSQALLHEEQRVGLA